MNVAVIASSVTFAYALIAVLAYAAALQRKHRQHRALEAQYAVLVEADAIVQAELIRILTAQSN